MMGRRARPCIALLASYAAFALSARTARADDLTLTTREQGSWSEGRTIHVQAPPATQVEDGGCKWGRGYRRHGGCLSSPLGWTIPAGILALGFTGAAVGSTYVGVAHDNLGAKLAAVPTSIYAVGSSLVFAAGVHMLRHPPGKAEVRPSLSFTSKGATLGVALSF
jgi:hypothetical protein